MYRKFAFEGEVHEKLDCVPLTVRRKLDLAAFKISLKGWQDLSAEERLGLCYLPVDTDEEVAVYREVFRGVGSGRSVPRSPLPTANPSDWSAVADPARVVTRLTELRRSIAPE